MIQKSFFASVLFLILISHYSHSQYKTSDYLVRASIGASGSSENITVNNNAYAVQQSIGQASVIGTFYDKHYTVRQGFIQPNVLAKIIDFDIPLSLEATVYPNPVEQSVTISFSERITSKVELAVFDLLGRVVFSKRYAATDKLMVELNWLPAAHYILKATGNNKQFIKKIIKK